jgi:hypothetical protein
MILLALAIATSSSQLSFFEAKAKIEKKEIDIYSTVS